jgi:hypothetical protein
LEQNNVQRHERQGSAKGKVKRGEWVTFEEKGRDELGSKRVYICETRGQAGKRGVCKRQGAILPDREDEAWDWLRERWVAALM